MTTRQITIDWAILDALDQRAAILQNQLNGTLQSLADLEAGIQEIRGQLQAAFEAGGPVEETMWAPDQRVDLTAPAEPTYEPVDDQPGQPPEPGLDDGPAAPEPTTPPAPEKEAPSAEGQVETDPGTNGATPPGAEAAAEARPKKQPRQRRPRRSSKA